MKDRTPEWLTQQSNEKRRLVASFSSPALDFGSGLGSAKVGAVAGISSTALDGSRSLVGVSAAGTLV
jgi:hypothetical protein